MKKEGKFVRMMEWIMETTNGVKEMFVIFTSVVVYFEFIFPLLTFSAWIITPIFILAMIGGTWKYMRESLIDKNKKEDK